jgi:hypothetical protein
MITIKILLVTSIWVSVSDNLDSRAEAGWEQTLAERDLSHRHLIYRPARARRCELERQVGFLVGRVPGCGVGTVVKWPAGATLESLAEALIHEGQGVYTTPRSTIPD